MRSGTSRSKLGSQYGGLTGTRLLEQFGADGDLRSLEAFFRYAEPSVAADAAAPMLASGAPHLVELLVSELFSPTLAEPFPSRFVAALNDDRPSLSTALAGQLAKRLRDAAPFGQYESARPTLEIWVIEQKGEAAEELALAVIGRETPSSAHSHVREAAIVRCLGSDRLLQRAVATVARELDAPSAAAWQDAAGFVERICRDATSVPAPAVPLVKRLAETASQHGQADPFSPDLEAAIAGAALEVLEATIGGPQLPDTPGVRALVRAGATVAKVGPRAALFATAVTCQPQLWNVVQTQVAEWDERAWKRNLKALIGREGVHRPALTYLLQNAPLSLTASIVELAFDQAVEGEGHIEIAGQRLHERLEQLGDSPETIDDWIEATYWPRPKDEVALAKFSRLLECLEAVRHVRMVVRGFLKDRLPTATAAALVPADGVTNALKFIRAGARREEWAAALADAHPDAIGPAVQEVHAEACSFDLVRGLATAHASVAFARPSEVFSGLPKPEKDELVALLAEHATEEQLPLLEEIVADDHRENADRRATCARRIADLLEVGSALPVPVIELSRSGVPKLREAGVRAIEKVKPRDPVAISSLHSVVERGGAPAKAATEALDALADEFVAAIEDGTPKAEAREIIPLLGATGRPQVLPVLFDYVGADAVYDDVDFRRLAANAIREAAEHISSVAEEPQTRLVTLLDGDEREVDPKAHAALSAALARLQLREDAALQILYAELPFKVKGDPDELFGAEKPRLVRQLALYARARDRGEAGWGESLAYLDNVAERLVRAAYSVADGGSESIKDEIRSDPRTPEYGRLLGALSSVGKLQGIQDDAGVLHDLRCTRSEAPHPGEKPDQAAMTTASQCIKEIAKTCVGMVQNQAHS